MQTKHFVNDPEHLVKSALKSLCIVQPELKLDLANKTIYGPQRKDGKKQVSIISGGGAGHEPSFTGFVGEGLLTAAVSGSVFASPSSQQVLSAIESVDSSQGALLTVMNYTGDVMNFGVALEKARARNPELKIEMLVVGDDVAVSRSRAGKVGRRGIAGTVLVHKITGAMAAAGYSLDEVVSVGRIVANNIASIGVSLGRVHVPGRPVEGDQDAVLGSGDIELGMGIHNETGCGKRSGGDAELPAIIREMLRQILDGNDQDRNYLPQQTQEMVLLVNNLGALSVLEVGAVVTEVVEQLELDYQIKAAKVYAGTFMTSLDGPGFSISLLNVIDTGVEKGVVESLEAPSNARGWQSVAAYDGPNHGVNDTTSKASKTSNSQEQLDNLVYDIANIRSRLQAGLRAVIQVEPEITKYDEIVGDGDCGKTLKRGSETILTHLENDNPQSLVSLLATVTSAVEAAMDGTSGALYSIFLNSLFAHIKLVSQQSTSVDAQFWATALSAACASLGRYTPAQIGDRTAMDALLPFVEALKATGELASAVVAAGHGAESTKDMKPSLGRTVYIGDEGAWMGKIPDPGAVGLSKFFDGLVRA